MATSRYVRLRCAQREAMIPFEFDNTNVHVFGDETPPAATKQHADCDRM